MVVHRRAMLRSSLMGLGTWALADPWRRACADVGESGRLLAYVTPSPRPDGGKADFGFTGLVVIDPTNSTWRQVSTKTLFARFSPDGKRIAIANRPAPRANGTLWVGDVDGPEPLKQVAELEGSVGTPVWSPDGRTIATSFRKRGADGGFTYTTVRMAPDGKGIELWPLPEGASLQDWSPDGSQILVMVMQPPKPDAPPRPVDLSIQLLKADGTKMREVTGHGAATARFAPDGRRIAYCERTEDGCDLWIEPVEKGERRRIPVEELRAVQVCWSPDGKSLAIGSHKLSRGPGGRLGLTLNEPLDCKVEIAEVDGDGRRALDLPGGYLYLNDWR